MVVAKTERLLLVYVTVPPAPNATELESVPVKVKVLLAVKVLPSAIVSVAPVVGAVSVILLMLVAVATPRTGVVSVGEVAKTRSPDPVSSVIEAATTDEAAEEIKTLLASVNTILDAVRLVAVMLPDPSMVIRLVVPGVVPLPI